MTDPVPAPTGRRLYVYSAHQDDETLWSGQIIAHHALVGREVHIVLCTDGSTSATRDMLNGTTPSGWWGGYHYPAREGIPAPLSPQDFASARDREMTQAARELGVTPDRLHLRVAERTASISVTEARDLILANEALTPDAGHYATHWKDPDPNHAALGEALRQLATEGRVSDARWVLRRSLIGTGIAGATEYAVPASWAALARQMTLDATRCYGAWAPGLGMYAIGEHSVHTDLAWAASGANNVIVKMA